MAGDAADTNADLKAELFGDSDSEDEDFAPDPAPRPAPAARVAQLAARKKREQVRPGSLGRPGAKKQAPERLVTACPSAWSGLAAQHQRRGLSTGLSIAPDVSHGQDIALVHITTTRRAVQEAEAAVEGGKQRGKKLRRGRADEDTADAQDLGHPDDDGASGPGGEEEEEEEEEADVEPTAEDAAFIDDEGAVAASSGSDGEGGEGMAHEQAEEAEEAGEEDELEKIFSHKGRRRRDSGNLEERKIMIDGFLSKMESAAEVDFQVCSAPQGSSSDGSLACISVYPRPHQLRPELGMGVCGGGFRRGTCKCACLAVLRGAPAMAWPEA